jgi:hypothetical protein
MGFCRNKINKTFVVLRHYIVILKKIKKKIFFFHQNFRSRKILKMENKHPSIFGQNKILFKKIKKNLIFEIL